MANQPRGDQETVKVVQMDTRYVQTDPKNFKSVVQELTGKSSCIAWIQNNSFYHNKYKRKRISMAHCHGRSGKGKLECSPSSIVVDEVDGGRNSFELSIDLLFKDLDNLAKMDVHPLEDYLLCVDSVAGKGM
ncbi:hypothetical protein ACFE04_013422 [Oxalis oulophora]